METRKSKKIVVLGHFGVGKTSLIRRFVSDMFSDNYKVTIGVHITKKIVDISVDEAISFIIWDLEGTDDPQLIRSSYLLGSHGAIFVFDVARPSTFQNIEEDLKIIKKKIGSIPFLVVGNKVDLVDSDEIETILSENGVVHDFLSSAKTGGAVNDLFLKMANQLN